MKNNRIKNMAYVSICAVMMAVGAWITIPFAVPFTMQTFVLYLILHTFDGKIGAASIILYFALGAIGLPVFSGFNTMISAVSGPGGGYIFGFLLVGTLYFALNKLLSKSSCARLVLPFASMLAIYCCGALWYILYFDTSSELLSALAICVLPYVLPDCIKITLALVISKKLRKALY